MSSEIFYILKICSLGMTLWLEPREGQMACNKAAGSSFLMVYVVAIFVECFYDRL